MQLKEAKLAIPDVYWVGVLDPDLRVFDIIMRTEYGTSYNAYLIRGTRKTALIETCKEPFFASQLARIREICDPAEIDYLVVNHTEPDHSGSIEQLLTLNPELTVVGTVCAINFCKEIVNRPFRALSVKEGDTLDLGDKTLTFIAAPFLHWPDTMYTYLPERKALFTCDSFGSHFADERVFNDLIEGDFNDAYRYYFDNIIGPYRRPYLVNALRKIEKLPIEFIGTGHGPVLRTNIGHYLDLYRQWCDEPRKTGRSVAIAYVSAYGYTAALAETIADELRNRGIAARLFDLVRDPESEALDAIRAADGVLFGSPTILGDSLPPVNRLLDQLNPTIDKGKLAGAFGSYAWSGEAVANLEARLGVLKLPVPVPGYRIKLKPNPDKLAGAREFAQKFATALGV